MARRFLGLACVMLLLLSPHAGAQSNKQDILALSQRIDALIEKRCKEAGIELAPPAADSVYFRRLHLDLAGRIPNLLDARDFVDNTSPDKRWEWVERLLAGEQYANHFARIWRAHLLSNSTAQILQGLTPGFEMWLTERLKANMGYDRLAHDILMGSGPNNMGFGQASPAAFYFASENKPENLAGATSRVFLGVKLECAQCHSHPFAKWTREQFWEFAAFFAGTPGNFRQFQVNPVAAVDPNKREIQIPGTTKTVKARFLTGAEPTWKEGMMTRQVLADWVTSPDNPYFARATADQLWSYFFGISLMEPILEPSDDQTITHPEILDELARELVAHKFDLKYLIQAIVHTRAYQRATTAQAKVGREDYLLFARMSVRGLTPDQLYDSVLEATYFQEPQTAFNQRVFFMQPQTPRGQFLTRFTTQDKRHETQTSILQALFMMNGKFLTDRINPENNESLATLIRQKTSNEKKVETLYLMVLSRLPRAEESARLVRHVESGDPSRTIPDVYWALLNSAEFMLNH